MFQDQSREELGPQCTPEYCGLVRLDGGRKEAREVQRRTAALRSMLGLMAQG